MNSFNLKRAKALTLLLTCLHNVEVIAIPVDGGDKMAFSENSHVAQSDSILNQTESLSGDRSRLRITEVSSYNFSFPESDNEKQSSKRAVGVARNWLRTREDAFHGPDTDINGTVEVHHTQLPWGEKRNKNNAISLLPQISISLPTIPSIEDPPWLTKMANWIGR